MLDTHVIAHATVSGIFSMASLSRGKFYSFAQSASVVVLALAIQLASSPVHAQDEPQPDAPEASESRQDDDDFDFDEFENEGADEAREEEEILAEGEDAVEEDEGAYKDVEVITVTANKREENIQEVPISVTALDSGFIEETGLTDFTGIQKFVPNLAILDGTDTRSTSVRIRGIGSVGTNAGIDPSVGLFIDGVYQGRAGMSMSDLLDIQAIEVLRGPQGTLYGKNTAAGLISIRTANPTYSYQAMAEGTLGNYDQAQMRAMFNVPVVDERIATRTSVYRTLRGGWDENLYTGGRVNELEKWGIRNKWLIEPHDDVKIVLAGDYAHQTSKCCVPDIITYEGDSLLWRGFNPITPPAQFPDRDLNPNFAKMSGYLNPTRPDDPPGSPGTTHDIAHGAPIDTPKPTLRNFQAFDGVVDVDLEPMNDVTIWGVQADVDWVFGDWSVNSLTAYRQYQSDSQFDGDFSQYNAVVSDNREDLEQVSTELRLTSPLWDHVDFTSGLYFFYMNHYNNGNLGFEQDFADIFLRTQSKDGVLGWNPINNNDINRYKTYSYAAYAQGNYKFLDDWRLTGGVRVSYEKKTLVGSQIADSNLDAAPISGPDIYRDEERAVTNVSGTVKLSYTQDEWMAYASFATGFKSGGFNQLRTAQDVDPEFDDEKALAYETGVRSSWFDNKLITNLTGYFTDYDDFQAQSFSGTAITIRNAGRFFSYGFESEIVAMPFDDINLTWTTGVGLNMTRYDEFKEAENTVANIVERAASYNALSQPTQPGEAGLSPFFFAQRIALNPTDPLYIDDTTAQDLSGKRLDNAPRWSLNSSLHYERAIGSTDLKWIFHTDYSFRSEIYLNQDLDPNLYEPGLHLLDFRVGIGEETNAWQLLFWVTNTIGEDYMVTGFDVPVLGGFAGIHGPPRQFGATFRWKY